MNETKREQYVADFFAQKLQTLADMPQCLHSIFDCSVLSDSFTITYASVAQKSTTVTCRALPKLVDLCAANIQHRVGAGDGKRCVIIKLNNYNRWIEIFWGVVAAGYIPILLANNLNVAFVDEIYRDMPVDMIITDGDANKQWQRMTSDECLCKTTYDCQHVWADKVILLSSGTDGTPKMVTYTGAAMCKQIAAARALPERTTTIMYPPQCGKLTILGWLPFSHIFGFVAVLMWYSFFGKHIVVPESLDLDTVSAICNDYAVTHVYAVPQFWNILAGRFARLMAKCPEKDRHTIKQIQYENLHKTGLRIDTCATLKKIKRQLLGNNILYCIAGGSDLSFETTRVVNSIGYPLHNGYGMTETGVTAVDTAVSCYARLQRLVGKPLAEVEYKTNEKGELYIYSSFLPIEIKQIGGQAQTDISRIESGDIVEYQDPIGYAILGRAKQIVITDGGEKLIPTEIKNAYGAIPYVKESRVECSAADGHINIVLHLFVDDDSVKDHLPEIGEYIRRMGLYLSSFKRATDMVIHSAERLTSLSLKGPKTADLADANEKRYTITYDEDADRKTARATEIVRDVLVEVAEIDKDRIYPNSYLSYDLGVTSMQFFEIVLSIENRYKIHFFPDVYTSCSTVMDLIIKVKELL